MKLLILTLLFASCGLAPVKTVKPRVIIKRAKPAVKKLSFKDTRAECIKKFYEMGMKSDEAITACKFVENR